MSGHKSRDIDLWHEDRYSSVCITGPVSKPISGVHQFLTKPGDGPSVVFPKGSVETSKFCPGVKITLCNYEETALSGSKL